MEDEIKFSSEDFKLQLSERIKELEHVIAANLNDVPMAEKNLLLNQSIYAFLFLATKISNHDPVMGPGVIH